jgi:hypothetical protein
MAATLPDSDFFFSINANLYHILAQMTIQEMFKTVHQWGSNRATTPSSGVFVGGHPSPEPSTICGKPVDLSIELCTDEHGH